MASFIRILHASPNTPPVDLYANGLKIATHLSYREFTNYLSLPAGTYNLQVFPAGRRSNPVLNTTFTIAPNSIQTLAVTGMQRELHLLPMPEPRLPRHPGIVSLRFAHLAPNAPAVDLRLANGTPLFQNIQFNQVTPYRQLHPGTYTLELFPAGGHQRILYVPNVHLQGNRFYTADAVGLVGEQPPLQLLIPLDGNSYL